MSRTLVVGVVNATPDSFSDARPSVGAAIEHGLTMLAAGADVLDVGGESTRPGAGRVPEHEEHRRVLPVVRELVASGAQVSVDTTRASVAAAALAAGAGIVNDVSGGLADPGMLAVLAEGQCTCVLMHWRGPSVDMQTRASYDDVVAEVSAALQARREAAVAAGVSRSRVVLDPGLGFGKDYGHNWALLRALDVLPTPLLVGASRKGFLGALLRGPDGARPTSGRDAATAAVTVLAAQAGAWGVRVHDVSASADAVRVVEAVSGV